MPIPVLIPALTLTRAHEARLRPIQTPGMQAHLAMTNFWRATFLLLMFGNLFFFAWSQGYFGRLDDGREPQRVSRQLDPEKLQLTSLTAAEAAARLTPPPVVMACRQIKELTPEEARLVLARAQTETSLAELKFGSQTLEGEAASGAHWDHIPAWPDKAAADRKMQESRQLGITDAALMRDETTGRFAISLGVFSTPEAAATRLQDLTKHGVRTAIISPRTRAPAKALLTVRGPKPVLDEHLPDLLNTLNLGGKPGEDCPIP